MILPDKGKQFMTVMKKILLGIIVVMAIALIFGISWGKLFKRGYNQDEYGMYTMNVVNNIDILPFNEISLDEDKNYLMDVDFDEEMEKISRNYNGDVLVYKKDNNGDYSKNVSLEIPYCWIRLNPCCHAHNAFTTINYLSKTIFTESHSGCCYSEQKKYQKIDDSWKEITPIMPLSIINKDLLAPPHLYCEWLWGDRYAWRWNYKRRII